jgi:hypothetical protein
VDKDDTLRVEEFTYMSSVAMKAELHKEGKCSLCLLLLIVQSTLLDKMNQAEDFQ